MTRQIRFIAILGRRSQELAELEDLGVSWETGVKVYPDDRKIDDLSRHQKLSKEGKPEAKSQTRVTSVGLTGENSIG